MRHSLLSSLFISVACLTVVALAAAALQVTPKRPVTDRYGKVEVKDDYRWLENWNDPAVQAWSDSRSAAARSFLDRLPMRAAVLRQVESLTQQRSPSWSDMRHEGAMYFALKNDPPKQQRLLVVMRSLTAPTGEKVLVDPNALDPSGATTIDFYVPSRDGSKVAVSLSKGGTESGTVYVWDVQTGRKLSDEVPRVNGGTAGGRRAEPFQSRMRVQSKKRLRPAEAGWRLPSNSGALPRNGRFICRAKRRSAPPRL